MKLKKALKLLRGGPNGVKEWNERRENAEEIPSLKSADLRKAILDSANLSGCDLRHANLSKASLGEADLSEADLSVANLTRADLSEANLYGAILSEADLSVSILLVANLSTANLNAADLSKANLRGTNLSDTELNRANFSEAICDATTFAAVDLSHAKHLDTIVHYGPSEVSISTLLQSGQLPVVFLRGCGVPDHLIEYLPTLIEGMSPIQFHSCFISYSSDDEDFAKRLNSRLRDEKLRVWYAPEDIQGGKKIHEQIEHAIRVHDKLLLILSDASMNSEWVKTEISHAREREAKEGKQVLFPVRLVSMEKIQDWKAFDADRGKDSAKEIREYFIPDFSNWKDHDSFEVAFSRLLGDLKASAGEDSG